MTSTPDQVRELLDAGRDETQIAAQLGIPLARVEHIADVLAAEISKEAAEAIADLVVVDAELRGRTDPPAGLEWTSPPPSRRGLKGRTVGRIAAMLAELQAHPGEWAVIHDTHGSTVVDWKRRGCEATSRRIPGSQPIRVDLYVRWPAGG